MWKTLFLLVIAAAIGLAGWKYWAAGSAAGGTGRSGARQMVAVETEEIRRMNLRDLMVFTGSIVAEERYDAAPKISGIIKSINFNAGDRVERGAVLAVLEDDEHLLEVERAEASLRVAQAAAHDAESQLAIAARDYARAENLRRELVISAQEFDRNDAVLKGQQAKYDTAVSQVRLAEANLKTANIRLGYTRVKAEWDGGSEARVIGRRFMDAGALAAVNTPILSVLDIGTVRGVISVSEKRYPLISQDGAVMVWTDAFPGRTFQGKVSRIPQELDALSREAELEVDIDNRDLALKPGMFIRAAMEFAFSQDAAAAPLSAVTRRDDGSRGIYLVEEGDTPRAVFQPVREGIVENGWVELVEGGELVGRKAVTLGQHLLKDGMEVRVAGQPQANLRDGAQP
ncbi:MAG: efflux RND transporter periplasmic adaptor subunit [Planctomycetota bacterium]|jgi:RND family efflux transporter MFP subunit|nr:efflux RND transporter periplasmic adaptor subunit [Planctomycetota bacterium]